LYVICAAAIAADLLIFKTKYAGSGLVLVLLGIPVYYLWKRFSGSEQRVTS